MPVTKLKTDVHGLYFKANGSVYRPVKSTVSYEIAHARNSREDGASAFEAQAVVNVQHRAQTPFATVTVNGVEEWWHDHGCYLRQPVEQCWTPAAPAEEEMPGNTPDQ